MKMKLSAAAAVFTWTFSSLAIAQVGQSSGDLPRLNSLPPLPAAQLSPQATVEAEPTESVTVTANKLREIFHKFTNTFAAPTMFGGKIARWERSMCPLVLGQNPRFTAFITQRVKYIALAAGARVNTEASCTPNIEIIFTTTPQALLDSVRQQHMVYLGSAKNFAELEKLATVIRPVQAWYTTETMDCNGNREVDSGVRVSSLTGNVMSDRPIFAHCGGRIADGIVSGFFHVLIVIDSTKMAGQKILPLSDYISMLALTQIKSLDACQQQPSVVNMLAADCDHAQDSLSKFDLAYLQGIYRMSVGNKLMFQRNDIADTMADAMDR